MTNRISLMALVKRECCNYDSGKCIGVDMAGKRFRKEESTKIFYQYPYEFEHKISGSCWIEEKKPCPFFVKCVLPLAPELTEQYWKAIKDVSMQIEEVKSCSCGNKIYGNERKCIDCKAKVRRLRNKRYRMLKLRRLGNKTPLLYKG